MRLEQYQKVSIKQFFGLWSRGLVGNVPLDHAKDCLNLIFSPGFGTNQISTREGLDFGLNLPAVSGVRRFFLGTFGDTYLILLVMDSGNGKIFPNGVGAPIYSPPAAIPKDFAGLNFFNRVYFTPNDGIKGIPNDFVYVWTDAYRAGGLPARPAAGLAPIAPVMVAAAGAAGKVDIGTHKFAVVYETDTGFLTPPGPKIAGTFTPTVFVAPGATRVDLSVIPIGPFYVVKRHILMTKANEEEFFFTPLVIQDNITTTGFVDQFDTDLVITADYLFDLMETIPSGVGLMKFKGRMFSWGHAGDTVIASRSGDIESISKVDGFLNVFPSERDGNVVNGSFVLRDVLYFSKFPGIIGFQDNGDVPSTWTPVDVDSSSGSFFHGMTTITISQPSRAAYDIALLASKEGIVGFNGIVIRPELTWKIKDLWDRITPFRWHRITMATDIWTQRIYVSIPIDGALEPNLLLMGDYTEGMDYEKIKWCPWCFPIDPACIGMSFLLQDGMYLLRIASINHNILYRIYPLALNDYNGVPINNYWNSSPINDTTKDGWENVYIASRFRVVGNGSLILTLEDDDLVQVVNPPPLVLAPAPGFDPLRLHNFVDGEMSIKIGTNALGARFTCQRIDSFFMPRWGMRPG